MTDDITLQVFEACTLESLKAPHRFPISPRGKRSWFATQPVELFNNPQAHEQCGICRAGIVLSHQPAPHLLPLKKPGRKYRSLTREEIHLDMFRQELLFLVKKQHSLKTRPSFEELDDALIRTFIEIEKEAGKPSPKPEFMGFLRLLTQLKELEHQALLCDALMGDGL